MKFLKQLFSITFVMSALLLSYVIFTAIGKLQDAYMKKIANEYAMFIVSSTPIDQQNMKKIGSIGVKSLISVPKQKIMDTYRNKISHNSLQLLEQKLPFFYEVYLEKFPTTSEIELLKKELFKMQNIKKVEVFSQNHDQLTSLLSFSNNITMYLFWIIFFLAVVILATQVKIWFYEHDERLYIMHLHGSSLLYSSLSIIKTAFLASVIASLIAIGAFFAIEQNSTLLFDKDFSNIAQIHFDYIMEFLSLLSISLSVSFVAILGVIIKHKTKLS